MNKRHYLLLKKDKKNINLFDAKLDKSPAYDHITTVEQFALEGNEEMVNLLIEKGAAIACAARGYAMANNQAAMNRLFDTAKISIGDDRLAKISALCAEGYALVGNDVEANKLMPFLNHIHKASLACGYARAHNYKALEIMHKEGQIDYNHLVYAYAYSGQHHRVYETIVAAQGASFTVDPTAIVAAYSAARDEERANLYKEFLAKPESKVTLTDIADQSKQMPYGMMSCMDYDVTKFAMANKDELVTPYFAKGVGYTPVAVGYAIAGVHKQVENYWTWGSHPIATTVATAYAEGGHHKQAKEFFNKSPSAPIEVLMHPYLMTRDSTGCHDCLDLMLDKYLTERTEKRDEKGKTKEYFHNSVFAFTQKSFTQKRAAVQALKDALNGESVDLGAHLSTLRNGELGKTIRDFVKKGGANVLLNTKGVNTVRDFVRELEKQNKENNHSTHPVAR